MGKGIINLSQVCKVKCRPYCTWISHNGRPDFLDSQRDPGFTIPAGPCGPSRAMPANCPDFKDSSRCRTLRAPWLSDPLVTIYPSRLAVALKKSPSLDCETKAWTPMSLKVAQLASKSLCQVPRIPGPNSSGVSRRTLRLLSQRLTKKEPIFAFKPSNIG